jgi:catechol 2,3-dioxygenase-like lactoylglutathione lyase family enzyme
MAHFHIEQVLEACLYVQDLDATRDFYHVKLGLPLVAFTPGRHVFFRAGTNMLLCFLAEDSAKQTMLPPHFAQGQQHIALQVPAGAEYDSAKVALEELGIKAEMEYTWPNGRRSLYFRDPDKHALEFAEAGLWDY